jgi:VanZ family protein
MIAFNQLVKSWLFTLAALFMLAALFVGGAQSGAGSLFVAPWDKLAHIVFFFSLTLLLSGGFNFGIATTAVLALLIGALDEFHQLWLPGRFPGVGDWLADVVGVVLAIGLIVLKRRHIKLGLN